jgi:hypothetical protein
MSSLAVENALGHLTAGYSLTLADRSLVMLMPDQDRNGKPLARPDVGR